MHHSISLTTNFVKNFFPSHGVAQQSSSTTPVVDHYVSTVAEQEQNNVESLSNEESSNFVACWKA